MLFDRKNAKKPLKKTDNSKAEISSNENQFCIIFESFNEYETLHISKQIIQWNNWPSDEAISSLQCKKIKILQNSKKLLSVFSIFDTSMQLSSLWIF